MSSLTSSDMFTTKTFQGNQGVDLHVLQISDCHLFAKDTQRLLGVYTNNTFAAVIERVQQLHKQSPIDVILVTGDISQDYSAESYALFCRSIETLNIPWFWIPGNHDENSLMLSELTGANAHHEKHILFDQWQIILLDSSIEKTVHGELDQQQLSFVKQCLEQNPQNAVVVMHHQPVDVGSEWLDNLGVANKEALWQALSGFEQVKILLWGHVHQEFEGLHNDIALYATPSTCVQFKRHSDSFAASAEFPGIRQLWLKDKGTFETSVSRVEVAGFVVDHTIGGY